MKKKQTRKVVAIDLELLERISAFITVCGQHTDMIGYDVEAKQLIESIQGCRRMYRD